VNTTTETVSRGPSVHRLQSSLRLKEAELRQVKRQLRQAEAEARAARDDANVRVAREIDLRHKAERQARHFYSLLREQRMWKDLPEERLDAEEPTESTDKGEEEAEEVGEEHDEQEASSEPHEDGSVLFARSKRSQIASGLFEDTRHLEVHTIADILSRLAQRHKCVLEMLQTDGLHRYLKHRDITLLKEARDHIQASMGASAWARWQHLAHVSMGKLMQLRVDSGYTRVQVVDSSDSDNEGTEVLVPKSMHPDYEFPSGPKFLPVPSKCELEREHFSLRDKESATHKDLANGKKGACMSLRSAILKLIFEALDRQELTRSGVVPDGVVGKDRLEYTIFFLKAGDGFGGKGVGEKIVRGGVSLISQVGYNCSPHDWLDIFGYGGAEAHDNVEVVMSDIVLELQAIERAGGYVEDADGTKYHVSLILGGDKPWQLEVAGKLNMNATNPWIECLCTQAEGVDLDRPIDEHNTVDAERACRLCHVCPNYRFRGEEWVPFQCEIATCTLGEEGGRWVTQVSVEKQEEAFCELAPKVQARARRAAAREHYCFKFGKAAPFRWLTQIDDPLHSFMNAMDIRSK